MNLQHARTITLHIATNNQKQEHIHCTSVECALTLHQDWVLVTGPKTYYSILTPRHNVLPLIVKMWPLYQWSFLFLPDPLLLLSFEGGASGTLGMDTKDAVSK